MSKEKYIKLLKEHNSLSEAPEFDIAKDKLVDRELISKVKGMLKGGSKKTILNLIQDLRKMV